MKKRITNLLILLIIILLPSISLSDSVKSIILIVDEMSLNLVEEIAGEKSAIGFINLKTRGKLLEENLYLSINKGRKLGENDLKDGEELQPLGEILKKEKTSYLGEGIEDIILWDENKKVDHEKRSMVYKADWLIKNIDSLLEDSNIITIGYDFKNQEKRIDMLKELIDYYKDEQIIIMPKSISSENENYLNKSLVPIIYIKNNGSAILTSQSTKREGFVVIEDLTAQIKNTYGYYNKSDIGNSFKLIKQENHIKNFNNIYQTTNNLLIISYIFHGILYLSQGFLGIWLLKYKKIPKWIYFIYLFSTTNIFLSIILGFFQFHENIIIYLIISLILNYILTKKIAKNKGEDLLILLTYGLIVLATIFYPKIIYNSYIGFNNLIYGARYYGHNNGIMGVLIASSIISFFIINKNIKSIGLKKIIGIIIFGLNMIVLSTKFATNTGGFITSIILFILIMYMILFPQEKNFKQILGFLIIGIVIFTLNMTIDKMSGERSHLVQFFYRLKNNGFKEFIYMASYKIRELISLSLMPPFSVVLIFQGIILAKLKKKINSYKNIKKEASVILITSLVGFFINDTGMIMLIYMLNFFILYIIYSQELQD